MRIALFSLVLLVGGCVIQAPPREVIQPAPVAEEAASPAAVVSVYEEPPLSEPAPIAVGWAPPPMLVEAPPPPPFPYAVWVGGYWVWQGNWVWAHGHWMAPPRAQYVWVHPYYEHRGGAVIFISGYWSAPGVVFVPPRPELVLAVEPAAVGVIPGPRPIGPEGCFVPAPPGSRRGIIIPAPVGTAPAVVTSAPPVVAVGMRVTTNVTSIHNTNVTNIHNTNVTNITNVTIVAPPAATANGRAFSSSVPAAPHLAAARPALVQARAPQPVSTRAVMPYVSAHASPVSPPPQAHGAVAEAHPQPMLAREPQPVRAGSMAGSARPEARPQREEREREARALPARSVQSAPAKAAAAATPVTRTPAPKPPVPQAAASKTAAAKAAPAHPDKGKAHTSDAGKDAQREAHP